MENVINNNDIKKLRLQLRCFVCEADVQGRYYYLATCRTQSSQSKVIEKLGELVGERLWICFIHNLYINVARKWMFVRNSRGLTNYLVIFCRADTWLSYPKTMWSVVVAPITLTLLTDLRWKHAVFGVTF